MRWPAGCHSLSLLTLAAAAASEVGISFTGLAARASKHCSESVPVNVLACRMPPRGCRRAHSCVSQVPSHSARLSWCVANVTRVMWCHRVGESDESDGAMRSHSIIMTCDCHEDGIKWTLTSLHFFAHSARIQLSPLAACLCCRLVQQLNRSSIKRFDKTGFPFTG